MNEEKKPWNITGDNENSKFKTIVHKKGRYPCKLERIKEVEMPVFQKPEEKEAKLMWLFVPTGIPHEEDESTAITKFTRPTMSDKGRMVELLCQLDPNGFLPEGVKASRDAFQKYAESFVGKHFNVVTEPSKNGKYNNFISAIPLTELDLKVPPVSFAEDDLSDIPF